LRKPFEEFLIEGNRDRGMAIPEEVVVFQKGDKIEGKSFVP